MASPVPEKLQPLHNFLHTHLQWKHHRSSRSRLAGEASLLESPPLRSHTHTHRRHTSPANVSFRTSPPQKQSVVDDRAYDRTTSKSKITESSSTKPPDYDCDNKRKRSNEICNTFTSIDDSVTLKPADDESSPRVWNLRPRRMPVNRKQFAGGVSKIGTSRLRENNKQSLELNMNHNSDTRMNELPRISISLSRGEIEEDILFLTGSKPSRRPKKRPRAIQKQLDDVFPGLWLHSITVDSYKVCETASKG